MAISGSLRAASNNTGLLAADAVLIASPEYARGVTGAMKNGLDWVVGSEALQALNTAVSQLQAEA